ncbi:uncharacterized protein LOC119097333, partial [Pollicipes pollicipes]|uniref:uncharacterized protein LOC119097333 n=1 Tax=Pollicipes pollicipes TaxID=41117 RepID=UPI001885569D
MKTMMRWTRSHPLPHWPQDCNGGLGRQKTQIEKLMNSTNTSAVTAGNLLGSGRWELPIQYQAAVEAARMYDVMGLAVSDFRRGARFLRDYLSAINTTAHTVNVVACNVESTTLGNLVQPSAFSNDTAFVGFVDYDTDEETMFLDPEIQLNNLSCVQSEVLKLKSLNEDRPVVIVGCTSSVARLNNLTGGILNNTNVTAAVLS